MTERIQNEKFIQDMLEKSKEKRDTQAQTRTENVSEKEVEKNIKDIMEKLQKG